MRRKERKESWEMRRELEREEMDGCGRQKCERDKLVIKVRNN